MDDLISELEKIGAHESEVANKMRDALRSYKMDQLAQLIDQINVGDSV